jgi:hypothetical protein
MSDEFFDQLRESSRAKKLARQESNKDLILLLSGEFDIDIENIAPHQLRLSKFGRRCDIFLQKNSFHDLNNNTRGQIKDIEEFIETFFNL